MLLFSLLTLASYLNSRLSLQEQVAITKLCSSGRSRPSDKGGEGRDSHQDPEIRGVPGLPKKFFWPFALQFGPKNKGGGPSPGSTTD